MTGLGSVFGVGLLLPWSWPLYLNWFEGGVVPIALIVPTVLSSLFRFPVIGRRIAKFLLGVTISSAAFFAIVVPKLWVKVAILAVFLTLRLLLSTTQEREKSGKAGGLSLELTKVTGVSSPL